MNPVSDALSHGAVSAPEIVDGVLEYRRDWGGTLALALSSFAVGVPVGMLIITAIIS